MIGPDFFALTPARPETKKNKSNGTIKVIYVAALSIFFLNKLYTF